MRSKIFTLLAALAFLLSAGMAQAGTLTSATWQGSFQGTDFTLTTGGGGLVASGTAAGTSATVTVTVQPQQWTLLETDGAAPVFISQTLGGSQTIAIAGSGAAVGNPGVPGKTNVFIGSNAGGTFLFSVPLSVGANPGAPFFQITAMVAGLNIPVEVTASAWAWSMGSGTLPTKTLNGGTTATQSWAGSNGLVGGAGTVTLVAPSLSRVCAGGVFQNPPFPCDGSSQFSWDGSTTTLTLNFVPEPGTLLLLAAGPIGMVILGYRRRS